MTPMKAESLRSLAIGLLIATGVCGAVYLFGPSEEKTTEKAETLSSEEMKASLTDEGYVILTEDELNQKLTEVRAELNEAVAAETEVPEKVVYRTMITVTSGMTSIDVGDALVSAQIIKSRKEFTDTVEAKGLVHNLRPGTFEVQSDMTMDQVIATIYRQ